MESVKFEIIANTPLKVVNTTSINRKFSHTY